MNLTKEQEAIVASTGDIKVIAYAGTGKTFSLIQYAKARPDTKILYLVFNASSRSEAKTKFADNGITNVDIHTAHSLAYKHIVVTKRYKVSNDDILPIIRVLCPKLDGIGQYNISKLFEMYCTSNLASVSDVDFMATIPNTIKKEVEENLPSMVIIVETIYTKMRKKEIPCSHSFYLKEFQLSAPKLQYDYILYDEFQDSNPAMIDIFLKQNATKVAVGDNHQSIYAWRQAVNALSLVDFPEYTLSESFRFDDDVADIANDILTWKTEYTDAYVNSPILVGSGTPSNDINTRVTIGRSVVNLVKSALEYLDCNPYNKIYFEGGLNSYKFMDGFSIYDVYNIYIGKSEQVKNRLLIEYKTFDALKEFADKTENYSLMGVISMVEQYKYGTLNKFKMLERAQTDRECASMIFTTIHRSKGLEYDVVRILGDIATLDSVKKSLETREDSHETINENINLAYVAVTRTKSILYMDTPNFRGYTKKDELDDR